VFADQFCTNNTIETKKSSSVPLLKIFFTCVPFPSHCRVFLTELDGKLLFCPSLFPVNTHRSLESSLGALPSLFPVNPHRSWVQSQTLEKRREREREQRVGVEASGGIKRWCRASPSHRGRAPRVEGRIPRGSRGTSCRGQGARCAGWAGWASKMRSMWPSLCVNLIL